ncbi:MAG TPA: penicillin acylase family protein [Solirubrobacteraceae bacterium]|nr:penicillin acylase family protein [Solirubrobacteraceae bacterium]
MRKTMATMAAVAGLALAAPAALAANAPKDYSSTALNIIPSGQADPVETLAPGTLPNETQARMYNALTPLFDHVTAADLSKDFKPETYGTKGQCPCATESVPYPGVTIVRDKYDVPHVSATTHAGGVWASGWIAAEDRGLLLSQARYDSLVAAIDAPGLSAIGLIENLDNFTPSAQTERVVSRQTQALVKQGPEGRAVLRDIDTFVKGINAYNAIHNPGEAKFTRTDIYAFNALKDQFFGEGGGNQAQNAEFLSGLEQRLGTKKGYSVFDDLRQNLNAGSPTTVDGTFNYNHDPNTPGSPGSVLLKPGSYTPYSYASKKVAGDLGKLEPRPHASNELMVEGRYSATGHPLLVGGPQVGYFYPGLTYEIDMHAPGLNWRGATSTPFPGYLLIGRGPDFATTLTSAGADDTDQFAEALCGHSKTKYIYKGKCRAMHRFDAGTVTTSDKTTFAVKFWMTVNGPVIGYARAGKHRVAITSKRASYGKDVLDLLFNRRLSDGQVHSPKSFIKAASLTPQTFNSFYVDSKHVAEITTGLLPLRAKGTDPSLPTVGNGKYEWHGFLSTKGHPQGVDPSHTPVKGTMVNWNNVSAHGFGSAPDAFGGNGSVARVSLLNHALRHQRGSRGKWTLAGVTSAMNTAATQNVLTVETVPLLAKLLKGSKAPNKQASRMLATLVSWSRHGGNVLPNAKGQITNPGAAVINGAWTKLANAFMRPVLGPQLSELNGLFSRFDAPPGDQYNGWYQYFDRDIDKLLKIRQPQPFRNAYCGKGNLKHCRTAMWQALASAGKHLTKKYGTPNPAAWHASAKPIEIQFAPLPLITMQYTNRPSGIQQVISFRGHR